MARRLTAPVWVKTKDKLVLADRLCELVAAKLQQGVAEKGTASLIVSGGSTPLPFFKRLAKTALPWAQVSITLADERWLPPDHADSNEKLVRENLLVDRAAAARFISLYLPVDQPETVLGKLDSAVGSIPQPYSVVILGMGIDGHTASLFPGTAGLTTALDLDTSANVAVLRPTNVPQTRITLTRKALMNADCRVLHITGENKRAVLESALLQSTEETTTANSVPIAFFFENGYSKMAVYWSP